MSNRGESQISKEAALAKMRISLFFVQGGVTSQRLGFEDHECAKPACDSLPSTELLRRYELIISWNNETGPRWGGLFLVFQPSWHGFEESGAYGFPFPFPLPLPFSLLFPFSLPLLLTELPLSAFLISPQFIPERRISKISVTAVPVSALRL